MHILNITDKKLHVLIKYSVTTWGQYTVSKKVKIIQTSAHIYSQLDLQFQIFVTYQDKQMPLCCIWVIKYICGYLMMTHAKLNWLVIARGAQPLLLFLFHRQALFSQIQCAASFSWSTRESEAEDV